MASPVDFFVKLAQGDTGALIITGIVLAIIVGFLWGLWIRDPSIEEIK